MLSWFYCSIQQVILSLSSPSPICSYVHPTPEVQNLLSEIFKEIDVRINLYLVEKNHKCIPIILDVFENTYIAGSLKLLLNTFIEKALYADMFNIAIDPFVDLIPDT